MAVSVFGTDNVLYGSDYPHNIGDMKGCLSRSTPCPGISGKKSAAAMPRGSSGSDRWSKPATSKGDDNEIPAQDGSRAAVWPALHLHKPPGHGRGEAHRHGKGVVSLKHEPVKSLNWPA